jgi:tetratricopeptide (TPR) repeat protein
MKYIFILMLILSNFLFICGCITQNSAIVEKNYIQFAEEINTSQSYYDQMVSADPLNATAWCIRGMYYNNAFGQFDTALQSYNRGLELDPRNAVCWYAKGTTLRNMGKDQEAIACFDKAARLDPSIFRH